MNLSLVLSGWGSVVASYEMSRPERPYKARNQSHPTAAMPRDSRVPGDVFWRSHGLIPDVACFLAIKYVNA